MISNTKLFHPLSLKLHYPGVKFKSAFLMMKISNTDKFFSKFKLKAHTILNKVYSVFHITAVSYFGDIFTGRVLP